jgi:hypothetical protein
MYACILEIRRGFFEGVCTPSNATAHSYDPPPPPLTLRESSLGDTLWLSSENSRVG